MKKSFYIILLARIIQSCLLIIPVPVSNSTYKNANRYDKEVKSSTIAYQNREDKTQLLARFSKKEIEPIVGRVPIHSGTATQIANSLTKDLSTDWEKAWVIFRWISENIDYDVAAYNAGRFYDTACSVTLKRGKAVCGGYASLLEEMYETVGIPCFTISGYARGAGFTPGESTQSNHAWNAAKINGKWYLMDATWGSGSIDSKTKQFKRKFKEFYFAAVPSELIITHYPENPVFQFLEKQISRGEFSNKPKFNSTIHEYGILPDSKLKLTQASSGISVYSFRLMRPKTQLLITAVHEKTGQTVGGLVQIRENEAELRIHFPKTGRFEITVFGGPFELETYPSVITRYENVNAIAEELPETYGLFTRKQVRLRSPLQKKLSAKTEYTFEVDCLDAIDMALVANGNWLHLKKERTRFFGKFSGEAYTLFVKYPNQNNYSGLLKFEKR